MDCFSPIKVKNPSYKGLPNTFAYNVVPCGKCEACLKRKQLEWYTRLKIETQSAMYTWFVTLTYDEEHLPQGSNVSKEDVQLFNKRLRSYLNYPIKYFLTSEYGPTTKRPHYHAIYFDIKPKDLEYIEKAWQNGFVSISNVSDGRIKYVTGYIIEKLFVPDGREPIFNLISKGLGKSYVEKFSKWHQQDLLKNRSFVPFIGSHNILPRYLKEKIYTPAQRSAYARFLSDKAEKKYEERIRTKGLDSVIRANNSAYIQFIKEVKEKHKKKKQL